MAQRVPTQFTVMKRRVFIGGSEQPVGTVLTSTAAKGLRRLSALVSSGHLLPNLASSAKIKPRTGAGAVVMRQRRSEAYGAAVRRKL